MNTLQPGQAFKARSGFILTIEAIQDGAASARVTYPDGERESLLIALDEWPWIVETEGLISAGLAG